MSPEEAHHCGYTTIQILPADGEGDEHDEVILGIKNCPGFDTSALAKRIGSLGITHEKDEFIEDTQESCSKPAVAHNKPSQLGYRLENNARIYPLFPKAFGHWHIREIIPHCETSYRSEPCGVCDEQRHDAKHAHMLKETLNDEQLMKCAANIADRGILPSSSHIKAGDKDLAYGVVLINLGLLEEAVKHFTTLITNKNGVNIVMEYLFRSTALLKRALATHNTKFAEDALSDVTEAEERNKNNNAVKMDIIIRKAEILSLLHEHSKSIECYSSAIKQKPCLDLYLKRGREYLALDKYSEAEKDFVSALEYNGSDSKSLSSLAYTLHKRGKLRNAIEVYKEWISAEPDDVDALLSIGEAYLELGITNSSLAYVDKVLALPRATSSDNSRALMLKADILHESGNTKGALDYYQRCVETCLSFTSYLWCPYCHYRKAVAHVTRGHFYKGIKESTKVIVNEQYTSMKLTPEYVKAHYLKEYSRYLHSHLDDNLTSLHLERELSAEFTEGWVKLMSGAVYQLPAGVDEQPGLTPAISDVVDADWSDLSEEEQRLVCAAHRVGQALRVDADGFVSQQQRLFVSTGLAAIHIAQLMRSVWNHTIMSGTTGSSGTTTGSSSRVAGPAAPPPHSKWREVFNMAVRYRRLVDADYPVVWLDTLTADTISKGFYHENVFLKGEEQNLKISPYYDLVFGLMKTMIEHFKNVNGEGPGGAARGEQFETSVREATRCEQLLSLAREHRINQHGFLITTQVPTLQPPPPPPPAGGGPPPADNKHDGVILTLTDSASSHTTGHRLPGVLRSESGQQQQPEQGQGQQGKQVVFSVSTTVNPQRLTSYHSELHYLYNKLVQEIRRNGLDHLQDIDAISNIILSLIYYFYNLSPLSRGTTAVAYAVAIGLLMSVGIEVTGKLPHDKLHQFEAMLSGAPDAFILVTRRWMKLKRSDNVVSSRVPSISRHAPTLRHIIRLLNAPVNAC